MFEQLGERREFVEDEKPTLARRFYYLDDVVGFVIAGLLKMGEPFEAIPDKEGYFVAVRRDCRENHIKEFLWEEFPDFREKLEKAGLTKPNVAYKLDSYR